MPDLFARLKPVLASSLPWRKTDPKVRELKLWARIVVTAWVLLVIPLLLGQLVLLLLHTPRIFATASASLGEKRARVSTGFADGDVLDVLSGLFESLLLVLPLLGIVLTFARLGGRAGRGLWRTTQGTPVARAVAALGMAAVLGALVYTWLPNGDYEPIRPGEKGTLDEGVAAIARLPSGRPSLVSAQRAAEQGRLVVRPEADVPVTTTTAPGAGPSLATTSPREEDVPETTAVPAATISVAPSTTEVRRTTTTAPAPTTTLAE